MSVEKPATAGAMTGQQPGGPADDSTGRKPRAKAYLVAGSRRELEHDSAIDPDVIAERGYRTMPRPTSGDPYRPRENVTKLGIPTSATKEDRFFPGLLIPVYGPTGRRVSYQYKPRVPVRNRDGKLMKYVSCKGIPNKLDVHPRNSRHMPDPTVELWVTEGVKKADSMTSRGLCAIGLTGVYNWRSQLGTLGEWEDVALKGRKVVIAFDADARTNRNVARAMARFGRWLVSKGAKVGYLVVPSTVGDTAVKGADDYFAAGGTVDQLRGHITTTAPDLDNTVDTFTDARMAETLADDVLTGRFAWLAGLGWLNWDGRRWAGCSDATVGEAVRLYVMERFGDESRKHAASSGGDKEVVKGWLAMESVGRQRSALTLARGIVERNVTELDRHPDLLNAANGVVDLRTGELGSHDPDLMMTKIAGAAYTPGATHPDWTCALEAIPAGVREWYQLRIGQAITGYMPPDDLLVICQGSGENGKSTINDATARAAGSYHLAASHRLLTASPDQHPTELMDLQGVRYAVAEETPEARRLSVVRLKQTVGTPQITARKIAKDSVTFDATHSLFVSTNYAPVVEETDHGTWRRLVLVRFPFTFRKPGVELTGPNDRRGDPGLRRRLATDPDASTAVLTWVVEGARRWFEHEDRGELPQAPARVVADTRAWRGESDQVLAYIGERVVFEPGRHVAAADLLADLNGWLTARGHREWSDRTLVSRFGEHDEVAQHGVQRYRLRAGGEVSRPGKQWQPLPKQYTAWTGVRFATDADTAADLDEPGPGAESVQGVQALPSTCTNSQNHQGREVPAQGAQNPAAGPPASPAVDPDGVPSECFLCGFGAHLEGDACIVDDVDDDDDEDES